MLSLLWKNIRKLSCFIAAVTLCTLLTTAISFAGEKIIDIREWHHQKSKERFVTENDKEDKFYIYSWDRELEQELVYVMEKYPEIAERIEYRNLNDAGTYQEMIDELLEYPDAEKYPDMIVLEADYIKKYTNADYLLPVEECGVTSEDMSQMYPYTIQVGTDKNGSVKGLSYFACPGSFIYRADLADSLLGIENPEEMQQNINSWEGFLAVAKKIDKKSGGKTKIISSNDEIKNVFYTNKIKPWVTSDGTLQIDPAMEEYMDVYRELEKEDLTQKTDQWSVEWMTGASDDNVFGYFGCTWFLHWMIKPECGGDRVGKGTYGLWNICQGPEPYYWGGTWIAATKGCSDTDLAGKIMKTLCCDTATMLQMSEGGVNFMNNREAMREISDSGMGCDDFLGGQDFVQVFSDVSEQIDVSRMGQYDAEINELFDFQVLQYAWEEKEKEEAISDFKSTVDHRFPWLKAD